MPTMLLVVGCAFGASAFLWFRFVYGLDRIEPEPVPVLVRIGILGGLLSALCAGLGNDLFQAVAGIADAATLPLGKALSLSLFVGFNEEFCKFLATLLLIRRLPEFNEPLDGLVYAATVALGFAAIENVEYILLGGNPVGTVLVRSVTAVPAHVALAGFWGYGLARAKYLYDGNWRTAIPTVALAAGVHASYDFVLFVLPERLWILSVGISLAFAYVLMRMLQKRCIFLRAQSPFLRPGMCPECGMVNAPGANYCQRCGTALGRVLTKLCPACGAVLPAGAHYCAVCGKPV